MREVVRGVVLGVIAFAMLLALAGPRAAGTGPWLLSRATGMTAFAALSLDVILGLAMSTRTGDRWLPRATAIDLHGWLSPLALALVLGHAWVLLADGYVRFDLADVTVPFVAPYRAVAVGIGVIAAYLAVVVHASFGLRRRLGTRTWRRLHYLSFAAFAGAAVHAILAGTDARRPWAVAIYAIPLGIVVALIAIRVARACRRRAACINRGPS